MVFKNQTVQNDIEKRKFPLYFTPSPNPGVPSSVVQSLSHVWLCATPWTAGRQAPVSFTISLSLLKLMSIESVMPSSHLILSPLSLLLSICPRGNPNF